MDYLNALVAFLNFVFIPGLAYGSQLALGALALTLVYAVLRFSNFAHGDTMAFGTMWVILITWGLQAMGITGGVLPTALIALPFGIAITAGFVLATDRAVYRFYRTQKVAPIILVIVSTGVMFVMNGLTRIGESEADAYSLRTVNLPDALAGALVKTAEYRNPRPEPWAEFLFYTHPSVERRVRAGMEWKAANPPS